MSAGGLDHVAVVRRCFLDELLAGRKTIESRLTATRRDPFGRVRAGERVYLKESGGPFRGVGVVERAEFSRVRGPRGLWRVLEPHMEAIGGAAIAEAEAFVRSRERSARFVSLVWLRSVAADARGVSIPKLHGRAWLCLPRNSTVLPCGTEGGASVIG